MNLQGKSSNANPGVLLVGNGSEALRPGPFPGPVLGAIKTEEILARRDAGEILRSYGPKPVGPCSCPTVRAGWVTIPARDVVRDMVRGGVVIGSETVTVPAREEWREVPAPECSHRADARMRREEEAKKRASIRALENAPTSHAVKRPQTPGRIAWEDSLPEPHLRRKSTLKPRAGAGKARKVRPTLDTVLPPRLDASVTILPDSDEIVW